MTNQWLLLYFSYYYQAEAIAAQLKSSPYIIQVVIDSLSYSRLVGTRAVSLVVASRTIGRLQLYTRKKGETFRTKGFKFIEQATTSSRLTQLPYLKQQKAYRKDSTQVFIYLVALSVQGQKAVDRYLFIYSSQYTTIQVVKVNQGPQLLIIVFSRL